MKISKLSLIFGTAVLLAACSDPPRPADEIVAERAQARWDALVSRAFDEAWEYHAPGFRARNPREIYAREMADRPIRWDSAELRSVECENQRCTVTVFVGYTAVGARGVLADMQSARPIDETWVFLDGDWWISVVQ